MLKFSTLKLGELNFEIRFFLLDCSCRTKKKPIFIFKELKIMKLLVTFWFVCFLGTLRPLSPSRGYDTLDHFYHTFWSRENTLIFYKNQHNLRSKAFFFVKKSKIEPKKPLLRTLIRTILLPNEAFSFYSFKISRLWRRGSWI